MMMNFLNSIVLFGAIQGILFGCLLFFNPLRRMSNKFLGLLLFLPALASLNIYLNESFPFWQVQVFLDLAPMILIMAVGPLIFLYTKSLQEPSFIWKSKYWLHFLPVIIDLLPTITGWVLAIGFFSGSFTQSYLLEWGNAIDSYNSYADIPRWISITTYIMVSRKYLKKHKTGNSPHGLHAKASNITWIVLYLNVFYIFQWVWFAFLIFYIIPSSRYIILDNLGYYPIYIPLAFLIYGLGIKGYLHSKSRKRYNGRGSIHLGKEDSEKLASAIQRAMEEDRLYLRPDFSLGQLVGYVKSDQRKVSYVLNHNFSKSFNSFINYYRIEEVKQKMTDPSKGHLTLSGIAYECGFNSQSTFQRAFRQCTGVSPKKYLSGQSKA